MAAAQLLGLSAEKHKLVKGDNAIAISVSFLEQIHDLSVADVAAAIGVCSAEQAGFRAERSEHLTKLLHVD